MRRRGVRPQPYSPAAGTVFASPLGSGSAAPSEPDFSLTNTSVTTAWGVVAVGELVPNGATPAGAYFVLVDNPAGLAVENG